MRKNKKTINENKIVNKVFRIQVVPKIRKLKRKFPTTLKDGNPETENINIYENT